VTAVDVFLVSFNAEHLLDEMFTALRESTPAGLRLNCLAVDNASSDRSAEALQKSGECRVIIRNDRNVGFGRANNQLLEHATGEYVLLLNTDAFVSPDTLERTIAFMEQEASCGVLGVKLVGRDGELQPSCRYFPTPLNLFLKRTGLSRLFPRVRLVDDTTSLHDRVQDCDWVPGCFYLVRRTVVEQVGLFDPRFFLYLEEVDHCRRVKEAGWRVVCYPFTSVVHIGGESAKSVSKLSAGKQISSLQVESELLYFRKHYGWPGLAAHMALSTAANVLLAARRSIKGRFNEAGQAARTAVLTWQLWIQTRGGTRPTR
jgi:N-acetylglucosaminyl-diphospho-decaprenol L-rhamnosyltransferase